MWICCISHAHTQMWLPSAYGGRAASARPHIRRFALHLRMEAPWVGTFPAIRRPSPATAGRRDRIRKPFARRSVEVPREFQARNRRCSWRLAVKGGVEASGSFLRRRLGISLRRLETSWRLLQAPKQHHGGNLKASSGRLRASLGV